MSQPSRLVRRLPHLLCRLAAVVLAVFVALPPGVAVGQEETEGPTIDLVLLDQPVWHDPAAEALGLKLRVVNRGITPIDGFVLTLTAHPVVSTRSSLHESFEGSAGVGLSATSKTYRQEIAAGESLDIDIDDPVSSLSSLASIEDNGVYPLTLTLSDLSGVIQHDALTTPLILYPKDPEPPLVPLHLALVVPLNDLPSEAADGTFRDPLGREDMPLEQAVSPSGWLTGLIGALEAEAGELPPLERTVRVPPRRKGGKPREREVRIPQAGLHLGIAPTPRFVQELADMADGYRRASGEAVEQMAPDSPSARSARDLLSRLSGLVAEEGLQTLLSPYSFPDIPALARNGPERLDTELDEGAEVLSRTLDLDISRAWLFPPGGRIAAQSLEELRFADADTARYTVFHPDALGDDPLIPEEGCPESFASFTCPVSVRTTQGPTVGLVGDAGLQTRFGALVQGADSRLQLQNLFAETAAIRQELPSIENRIVQVTMPALWHPSPLLTTRLLAGLRQAPWLETVTPAEAVDLADPRPSSDRFIQDFPPLQEEPPAELFEEIDRTEEFLDDFRRMQPPEQLMERLRRNTLVAGSRVWWSDEDLLEAASDYLDQTVEQAESKIEKITIGGPSEINLTSREGEIPLVVSNGTGFPTTVTVSVSSPQPDLELDPASVTPQQIAPEDTFQFTVAANARSSGIFPIEVVVQTSDGSLELAYKKITIRSTEFNRIAVGLTAGAFAFLVFFYLLRVARRQRKETSA